MTTTILAPPPFPDDDRPRNWRQYAVCASTDPDLFFSDDPAEKRLAITFCGRCPVRVECRQTDMAQRAPHRWGVWGGESERARGAHHGRTLRGEAP